LDVPAIKEIGSIEEWLSSKAPAEY